MNDLPIVYKPPKGTRDYNGVEQLHRERIARTCIETFRLYGVECMDTPCFEQTDVLRAKSETSKQTFELVSETENSEKYTLRYDQTMPFARFVKQRKLTRLRRYAIGPVFRRDQPNMYCARYRQFLQCDYDNLGQNQDIPSVDAETLTMIVDIFQKLKLCTTFTIKLNTVQVLKDLMKWCGIQSNLFNSVCRCLDKMNKQGWKSVKKELFQLGISDESLENLDTIIACNVLNNNKKDLAMSLKDMIFLEEETKKYLEYLLDYLNAFLPNNTIDMYFIFDVTLARGLDYYTGLLFEITMNSKKSSKEIGSVGAGGRYDGLCGEGTQTVGFSLGVDRLLKFVNKISKADYDYTPKVWIIQTPIDDKSDINELHKLYKYKLSVLSKFRQKGIKCGTLMKKKSGLAHQMRFALKKEIPYIVFVGEKEMRNETVTLKTLETEQQIEITLKKSIELIS